MLPCRYIVNPNTNISSNFFISCCKRNAWTVLTKTIQVKPQLCVYREMGENLFFAFAFIDRSKLCVFPKALRFKSKFITAELARLFSQSDSEEDFEGFDEDDARVDRRHFKMQFKTKV